MTPHDLLYPNVFFVESISTLKIRMFAKKNRAQNNQFWLNGRFFRGAKKILRFLQIFQKFDFIVILKIVLILFLILATWT